jgi:hypothetical protein
MAATSETIPMARLSGAGTPSIITTKARRPNQFILDGDPIRPISPPNVKAAPIRKSTNDSIRRIISLFLLKKLVIYFYSIIYLVHKKAPLGALFC